MLTFGALPLSTSPNLDFHTTCFLIFPRPRRHHVLETHQKYVQLVSLFLPLLWSPQGPPLHAAYGAVILVALADLPSRTEGDASGSLDTGFQPVVVHIHDQGRSKWPSC